MNSSRSTDSLHTITMNNQAAKVALITGVGGQDGAYLARLLIDKGYRVIGTSRDAAASRFESLVRLRIAERVQIISMAPSDFRNTLAVISDIRPDEIYHLAGQSSVGLSFEQPFETINSITIGVLNILESIRALGLSARLYHASSSECFGNRGSVSADEGMLFNPVSPYGIAKAAAHALVRNYRESYGMFASNGILFNHESPLRPARFVTKKVVEGAHRISLGSSETLFLGDLSVVRDWGWSPEYVEAMWMMLQADNPDDFVIATGESHSLEEFVAHAFSFFDLDWKRYVKCDTSLRRPNEIPWSQGNPEKANRVLGWQPRKKMHKVVESLCENLRNGYCSLI